MRSITKTVGFALVFLFTAFTWAIDPLVEYNFNKKGLVQDSTGTDPIPLYLIPFEGTKGDLITDDEKGVSGLPGDRAFDNSTATAMGAEGTGGKGSHKKNFKEIDQFSSFTLCGWFKTENAPLGGGARLFRNGGYVLYGEKGSLVLLLIKENEHHQVSAGSRAWEETKSWVFFAVTYDGQNSESNVKFYYGAPTKPVVLISSKLNRIDSLIADSISLELGNDSVGGKGEMNRPFQGLLDNLRIYGSASDSSGVLSLEDLELLRQKDIENKH